MNIVLTTIFVFVLVWWVVIFTVLPFGNRPPEEKTIGHAASAPANPRLKQKLIVTTILSVFVTAAIIGWLHYSGFSVYELVKAWDNKHSS